MYLEHELPTQLAQGITIFMLYPVVLLTLTFFCSATMSTLGGGVTCFLLLAVAIIGGFIEQSASILQSKNLISVGIISSLINPSDSVYRLAISTAGARLSQGIFYGFDPFGVAMAPSAWMAVYIVIYKVILLTLAYRSFSRRDF